MANEVAIPTYRTGESVYGTIRKGGLVYNFTAVAYEVYNSANRSLYDFALTEQGVSRVYAANLPIALTETVQIWAYARGTLGSELETDKLVGVAELTPPAVTTGSGARTVVVTVVFEGDPLESARVRVTRGAESYVATTDVDGTVTFYLDDGSWSVVITLFGYSFAGATLVVNGNENVTYDMQRIIYPPSDPGRVTGVIYTYDENGIEEAGVPVTLEAIKIPPTVTGVSLDGLPRIETSAGNGFVAFTNLFQGVTYRLTRGDGIPVRITVPLTAPDPWEMTGVVGPETEP